MSFLYPFPMLSIVGGHVLVKPFFFLRSWHRILNGKRDTEAKTRRWPKRQSRPPSLVMPHFQSQVCSMPFRRKSPFSEFRPACDGWTDRPTRRTARRTHPLLDMYHHHSIRSSHLFVFSRCLTLDRETADYWVSQKKLLHKSKGKTAPKKENDLAES